MQPYSCVEGIEFIKLNGEIVAHAIFYYRFFSQILGIFCLYISIGYFASDKGQR